MNLICEWSVDNYVSAHVLHYKIKNELEQKIILRYRLCYAPIRVSIIAEDALREFSKLSFLIRCQTAFHFLQDALAHVLQYLGKLFCILFIQTWCF